MYRYDQYDQAIVDARVAEFRDQVARRLANEITEDQFKPLRLMNGLYLQLHAYMLRVAVPYGTLSGTQMRMLAHIARTYDRGYGHFTTRQNIQYNWIKLAEAPDLLAELATVEMHAIQTSGNCIRNISSDQFAGAAADEVADPRPYAELLRQWSSFHPEFSFLPRKFKIAVIASDTDRAAIQLHDIGLQLVRGEGGLGFKVWVGGGMGRTPMLGAVVRDFIPVGQYLSYCEAILRVYNRHGRRDNIYKARIKILVHELGAEEFTRQVEAEWAEMAPLALDAPAAEYDRIRAQFAEPAYDPAASDSLDRSDPDFALWLDQNVHAHKQPGYAIATISLKPVGGIPGDATAEQMDVIADLAERFAYDEIRVTHSQNLVLAHVRKGDLYALWTVARRRGAGDAEPRPRHRHHRVPGPRLLRAGQRALDSRRAEDRRALRRPRPAARHRRAEDQGVGLHQRLRPPPCRPHRHPRRRPEGRGGVSAQPRRIGGGGRQPRQDPRPRFLGGRCRRRGREGN